MRWGDRVTKTAPAGTCADTLKTAERTRTQLAQSRDIHAERAKAKLEGVLRGRKLLARADIEARFDRTLPALQALGFPRPVIKAPKTARPDRSPKADLWDAAEVDLWEKLHGEQLIV